MNPFHHLLILFMSGWSKSFLSVMAVFWVLAGFGQGIPADKKILKPVSGNSQRQAVLQTMDIKVDIPSISEILCPTGLTRGDREFGGNGPIVTCEVKLRVSTDSTRLIADIYFKAEETKADWTTVESRWSREVYRAPSGTRISRIMSGTMSRTQFTSPPGGFQFLVPGADAEKAMKDFFVGNMIENAVLMLHGLPGAGNWAPGAGAHLVSQYTRGNTVNKVPAVEGTLVKFFHIVGDTGGDDVSTDDNCNDDTRIEKIEFFRVHLQVIKTNRTLR